MLSVVDRLVRAVALFCGGTILIALMGVTLADVIYRYVLNAPIFGSQDISILLLVLVIAFSIAYGGRTGAHVAVEVFGQLGGPVFDRITAVFVRLVGAGVMAVASLQLFESGRMATELEEGSQMLNIPFEPFYDALGVGVGLYAVLLALEAVYLAVTGQIPLLVDESRETGPSE